MNTKELKSKLYPIAEEIAANLGYEIVDIEYKKGPKQDLLTIFIYKEEGISTDDCQVMSRHIEAKLDERDFIDVPYYLEISSPGLDRPIKTQQDYRRNLNKEVIAKLYAPLDGQKSFEGLLTDYDDETVTLTIDEEEKILPIKSISLLKQTIKF